MRSNSRLVRLLAFVGALAFVAAACGDSTNSTAGTTTTAGGGGSTTTAAPSGGGETLNGMRGTTPLQDLAQDFKDRLLSVDSGLKDFNYGAESYDAATIIALAATLANTDGVDYAKQINDVTRGGTKCKSFKECTDLITAGTTDIDYDGVSGPLEFDGNGDPTIASFGILQFGADNQLHDDTTKFQIANLPPEQIAPTDEAIDVTRAGDGALKIGTLLPETGSLAFLGPPEVAGAKLAVQEINAAGGVLGKDVTLSEGDSGDTSTDTANQTVDRELSEGVDAIIGAASSGVTLTVIDKVTSAGVVMFSPANTSPKLSAYPDHGLYFRDAPSDVMQGALLGQIIADDGNATLGLLVLDDPYGVPLAENVTKSFESSGGTVVEQVTYDPNAQTFDSEVGKIKAKDPDAIMVIGFNESSKILATLVSQGIGPSAKKIYGCDGNMGNALGTDFAAGK